MSDGEGSFVTKHRELGAEVGWGPDGTDVPVQDHATAKPAGVDWDARRRDHQSAWTGWPEGGQVEDPDRHYERLLRELARTNPVAYHALKMFDQKIVSWPAMLATLALTLGKHVEFLSRESLRAFQSQPVRLVMRQADIETFTQPAVQMGKRAAAAIRDLENELETEKAERSRANAQIQRLSARLRQLDEEMAIAQKASTRQQRCIEWLAKRNVAKSQELNALRACDWEGQCYQLKVELGEQSHELEQLRGKLSGLIGVRDVIEDLKQITEGIGYDDEEYLDEDNGTGCTVGGLRRLVPAIEALLPAKGTS